MGENGINRPKFSIVIPLYNKQQVIKSTIDSCISQDFTDFEIVIVNDGSTDESANVVKAIKDSRIRLVEQKNSGPSAARNRGCAEAKGEWIVFIDADDLFLHTALSTFNDLITNYRYANAFCCNFYSEKNVRQVLYSEKYKKGIVRNNFFAWMTKRLFPRTGALVIRRDVMLQTPFDDKLRRYEDAEVLFRIFRKEKFVTSPTPVMINRQDYSAAAKPRKNQEEDFLWHLDIKGKSFWERVAIYELAENKKNSYHVKNEYDSRIAERVGYIICRAIRHFQL